jgi:hypothetical protein
MRIHLVTDTKTGTTFVQGRDGTRYTAAEYESARALAKKGDAAARALIANMEMPPGMTAEQMIHDCPECRAAMARGEKPAFGAVLPDGATLPDGSTLTLTRMNRHGFMRKRPRWRYLKRVAGR